MRMFASRLQDFPALKTSLNIQTISPILRFKACRANPFVASYYLCGWTIASKSPLRQSIRHAHKAGGSDSSGG